MRCAWTSYRYGPWFHRHLMYVHALGFVVAVQWAIVSAAAYWHHRREIP